MSQARRSRSTVVELTSRRPSGRSHARGPSADGSAARARTAAVDPAERRAQLWGDVGDTQWNDWRWQLTHSIRSEEALGRVIALTPEEETACAQARARFPMAVTPYYACLLRPGDRTDPIRQQVLPQLAELSLGTDELEDPLAEEAHMPVPGLTHRYPDRVLIYTTHNCAVYCRHCNRRRKVGNADSAVSMAQLRGCLDYIRGHAEVRDVLVSGGDPFTLSDKRLEALLAELHSIPHVEMIRIATRCPVTLPQRLTPALVSMLRRYHPIYVNTHFNHLRECTPIAEQALTRLADAGCVVGNQMVLLRGINDDAAMVRRLNQWLLARRCRPYYIFQCDPAEGIAHFRTPVQTGLQIIGALRGWTSGLAVPHYVLDLPGGGGKVPVQPDYFLGRDGKRLTFRNYAGRTFTYEEG